MKITLGSNLASLSAQRKLSDNTNGLARVFERLSSGQRINRASDDAAGLAVASTLNAKSRVYSQAVRNFNDGVSMLSIADGTLDALSNIVIRQRELAVQAASGTYSSDQRQSLNDEAQALSQEYARILNSSEFSGRSLFTTDEEAVTLQGGIGNDAVIEANYLNIHREDGVLEGLGTYSSFIKSFGAGGTLLAAPKFIVADMNNDGIDDIVASKWEDNGAGFGIDISFAVYLGEDGTNTFTKDAEVKFEFPALGGASIWDIDFQLVDRGGDGDLDIEYNLRQYDGSWNESQGYISNKLAPSGTFGLSTQTFSALAVSDQSVTIGVGDFNNDGINDVIDGVGSNLRIRIQDTELADGVLVGDDLSQSAFSLTSQSNALSAIDALETQLQMLSSTRGKIGAIESRLKTATSVLSSAVENFDAAESRIRDADVAAETAELVRRSILNNSAAAVLSQANQQPLIALDLLGVA